jgi:predicted GIY-YIG superfamily endonuclease
MHHISRHSCVYRFYDWSNRLLYVGVSDNLPRRLIEHEADKEWWWEVAWVKVEHWNSREEALAVEAIAIRTEKPRYNRTKGGVQQHGKASMRQAQPVGQRRAPEEGDTGPWCWRIRATGEELCGYLALYWEVEGDPISDGYSPDEISAEDLWRMWARRLRRPGRVPIHWFVISPGAGVLELAPFSYRHRFRQCRELLSKDFLTYFSWPKSKVTGELLNWVTLPVVDKLWRPGRADKGGFIYEATRWKPSALQPFVDVVALGRAARLGVPSSYYPSRRGY